jgi:hypothetical protein
MKTLPGIALLAILWALPLAAQEVPRTDQPSHSAEDTLKPLTLPEIVPQNGGAEINTPEVRIPSISIPRVTVPEINIPEVNVPEINIPEVRVPSIRIPNVRIPEINIPEVNVPEITIPEVRIPRESLEGMDESDRREMRKQLEEMRRNVQERREELRKLKKMVKENASEELQESLREAQEELEEARADLAEAQQEMMMYSFGGNQTFVISGDGEAFSAALAPQAQGHGGVLVWTDSTSGMALAPGASATMPKARRELMIRRFRSGDSSMTAMPRYREFSSTAPIPPIPPIPPAPPALFDNPGMMSFGSNNVVIVEGDSVLVNQSGKKGTVIRLHNKSINGRGKKVTKIIIIDDDGDETQTITTDGDVQSAIGGGENQAPLAKSSNESGTTEGYSLSENAPNPFDQSTQISFTLGRAGHALLTVFDATGKVVRTLVDSDLPAGSHSVTFESGDLPNGLYLYRLASGSYSETRTMTLQK